MAGKMSRFLTNLAVDATAHDAFQKNASDALKAAGITGVSRDAILSKNPATIRDALLKEKGVTPGVAAAGDTEIVLVVVI
ncbi:MAG: hypothetical protein HZY79_12890 [Rhodoblastus sp.]|nr:MAG: hypothetical protein HZY79_12890 [Rhodoblastus sp.]